MATNTLYTENFPHMSPAWSRIFNFVADRAEGSYIYTDDGRKLLDFTCGIGVTNTGHCHPKVVEAIREQAGQFIHAQANLVIHKPMLRLIEELEARGELDGYHLLPAAKADILRRLGRAADAARAYERALVLVTQPAERRYLERRLQEVRPA